MVDKRLFGKAGAYIDQVSTHGFTVRVPSWEEYQNYVHQHFYLSAFSAISNDKKIGVIKVEKI